MKHVASFHPDAQQELIHAAVWYDDRREGLGDEFIDAVSDLVADICRMPERFPVVHDDVQQAILRRFPFVVYFRLTGERVFVVSVFHASRDLESLWSRLDR
jgi:plasmid stabilization system protein ParE